MRYSQEKRSFDSKIPLMFSNLFFSSGLTIYIFSSKSSSPLLVFSSDVSTTSLHTSSLHSGLAYLPSVLLLSRKNINRLSHSFSFHVRFSRTVNCLLRIYICICWKGSFLHKQTCVLSRRASSAAINHTTYVLNII